MNYLCHEASILTSPPFSKIKLLPKVRERFHQALENHYELMMGESCSGPSYDTGWWHWRPVPCLHVLQLPLTQKQGIWFQHSVHALASVAMGFLDSFVIQWQAGRHPVPLLVQWDRGAAGQEFGWAGSYSPPFRRYLKGSQHLCGAGHSFKVCGFILLN